LHVNQWLPYRPVLAATTIKSTSEKAREVFTFLSSLFQLHPSTPPRLACPPLILNVKELNGFWFLLLVRIGNGRALPVEEK
jgi:hypothetical protein